MKWANPDYAIEQNGALPIFEMILVRVKVKTKNNVELKNP